MRAGRKPASPWTALAAVMMAALAPALAPSGAAGQATPHVPSLDPAYQDLEALVAAGYVRGLVLGQRPWSRATFARAVVEARARMEGEARPKARHREALERLAAAFEGQEPRVRLRAADLDVTASDAPPRMIPTLYAPVFNVDGRNVDAHLAPFLERSQGRAVAHEGWTVGGEALVDLTLGSRVAGQIHPRVWALSPEGEGSEADVTLLTGYLRGVFGNLSVEVGRNHAPHGHTRTYAPVISHNPRAFDLVRLSMEEPRPLPWLFRHLGPTRWTLYVADMGRSHDTPGSKLIVYEGAIRPHPNLELGGALLNHQFGKYAPPATWGQRIQDFFFFESRRFLPFRKVGEFSDKVLAGDARLALPGVGTVLYLEMMSTDDHNLFSSPGDGLGNNATWTGGVEVKGLGGEGRVDLWMEATRTGTRAYTHHQFTSGMTLDGRILGAPVGPRASGFQGGVVRNGTRHAVEAAGAWELYSGDLYQEHPETREYFRVSDEPDEVRLRATLEWSRHAGAGPGLRTGVRLGYERVTRFGFTDADRTNFMAQVRVGYAW